ncbi:hypothetical protein N7447_010635 [Penicillium robsamsonii]|uniref:uncharacterized protein n=1 Tax=Penicillium robsamsonii TaxID=1792511 RepID=UPI0025488FCB|nr:uncharacterized protein N7447_010635 [Penicillium robsamsonii]KAJ5811119.1 hypothetical protein N7447_010635 [Penicillium robsamsonii]
MNNQQEEIDGIVTRIEDHLRQLYGYKAEENFVLPRFLDSIAMPDVPTYPAMSEQSSSRRTSRRPPSDSTTPDRPAFSFALPPQPKSPGGSTRSGYSNTTAITHKSPDYTIELQMRGVIEAENVPPEFDSIRKALQRKSPGLNALDKDTVDGFNQLLVGPNNEATIQAVIVPNLIDQIGIVRNPQTYAINQAQFVAEGVLPPLFQGEEITKIPSPCPGLTIGLWRASFCDYIVVLHKLGTMASPIGCAPDIIFPCFTIEVKGDSGANDARMRNQNNAAHMLRHLRDLSSLAQGKDHRTCHYYLCTLDGGEV